MISAVFARIIRITCGNFTVLTRKKQMKSAEFIAYKQHLIHYLEDFYSGSSEQRG